MTDTFTNVLTDEIIRRQLTLLERLVDTCLAAASRLVVSPDSFAQLVAVALHGTIIEQAHACGALVTTEDFSSIPIIMRSLLEASIDQANLLGDAEYVQNMEAADHTKFLELLKQSLPGTNPLLAGLSGQHDVAAGIREKEQRISELAANGRRNLSIVDRFKCANAEDQYRSVYALLCLDSHNNLSALVERHMHEILTVAERCISSSNRLSRHCARESTRWSQQHSTLRYRFMPRSKRAAGHSSRWHRNITPFVQR